jgi:hypothetical protein
LAHTGVAPPTRRTTVSKREKLTGAAAAQPEYGERVERKLVAYPSWERGPVMPLVPAATSREWMDATHSRFAYRCLPLLLANQYGWFILNSHPLRVCWSGGDSPEALTLMYLDGERPFPAVTLFGYGILTFHIPYLFRTPPGYNLLVRGPTNWPKDGACALDGVVETDWSEATFTMNWQLTRPDHVVSFEQGEPICMIVPQRRGELESFHPSIEPLSRTPSTAAGFRQWATERARFKADRLLYPFRGLERLWQKHYFLGTAPSGVRAVEHQTRIKLRPFVATSPADPPDEE